MMREQFLKMSVGLGLVFVNLFRFSILLFFWFTLDCFVLVLFGFVVLWFNLFGIKPGD